MEETTSKLDPNHKRKETDKKFKYMDLKESGVDKYLKQDKYCRDYWDYIHSSSIGEIVIDVEEDKIAGYIFVDNKKYPGFITPLMVIKKYRGYGLGAKLLEDAIHKYNAIDLCVDKTNEVAIKLYKDHGFEIIGDGNSKKQHWMKLKSAKVTTESGDIIITDRKGVSDAKGVYNSVVKINGRWYRDRVECLILKGDKILLGINKKGKFITCGGSVEKDIPDIKQVENECNEEALVKVKNIRFTGVDYLIEEEMPQWAKELNLGIVWHGKYTKVFIGEYDGRYTKHVDEHDIDPVMMKAKWYPIADVIDELHPAWQTILRDVFPMTESTESHLYFYHMVDRDSDMTNGLISPEYMYRHGMTDLFLKNTDKYRDRLCNGWKIYPGRKPESLTVDEIYEGLKKFRGKYGNSYIYFFRFPPYKMLDKGFRDLYKSKILYRIDLEDPRLKPLITDIFYGHMNSNGDNDPLDRDYYQNITPDEYFGNFDPKSPMLFATLNHIAVATKTGTIPLKLLTPVSIPNTINDIYESVTVESVLKTKEDIYYNKDKFDSGEINLCIITGFSGAGKTTMMNKMSNTDTEIIEIDEVLRNKYKYTDTQLEKIGGLIEEFFTKGYGLETRSGKGPTNSLRFFQEFVRFSIKYAKSHPDRRIIMEGVWFFVYDIPPSTFDNCCICIKGTSAIKSALRAGKREFQKGKTLKDKIQKGYNQIVSSTSFIVNAADKFDKYVEYFSNKENMVTESMGDRTLQQIIEFNDEMNQFEYILVDPNTKRAITQITDDLFTRYYRHMNTQEFLRYNGGVCWDYVMYEANWFKSHIPGLKFKSFFVSFGKEYSSPTHTFILFQLDHKYYWFESSWKTHTGIYEFNSWFGALTYIISELRKPVGAIEREFVTTYNPTNPSLYGMNESEYMDYMFEQPEILYRKVREVPRVIYKGTVPGHQSY